MDCAQFGEIVHDLDRPGTQGLGLRDAALLHAETCNDCAQLMTETESLDFSLQQLGVRDADSEAPPRVEAALLREFRRHRIELSLTRAPWRFAALAVAATVLLALGLFLRHEISPNRTLDSPSQDASNQTGADTSGSKHVLSRTEQDQTDDSEYATAYVPLPGASDPDTLEGGSIVRVVLSRSALLSLGLPVTDTETGDQIPADLVLSQDGAPQAIRLVSQTNGIE
jgi:hypothetical protein